MDVDARALTQNGKPILDHVARWGSASWPNHETKWVAPLIGSLTFTLADGRVITLCGTVIQSITLGPNKAEIALVVDSPVPAYRKQPRLDFRLFYAANQWQVGFGSKWKWFKFAADTYRGAIGEWIQLGNQVPEAWDTALPFGKDGLPVANPAPPLEFPTAVEIYAGIFVGENKRPYAVLMPSANCPASSRSQSTGPRLDGLDRVELGGDINIGPWDIASVFYLPLDEDNPVPVWNALVNWAPLGGKASKTKDRMRADDLFEAGWNEVVRRLLPAQHAMRAAQPWLPLPILTRDTNVGDTVPLLRFAIHPTAQRAPSLDHTWVGGLSNQPYKARFDWQAAAIMEKSRHQPDSLDGTVLTFDLVPVAPAPRWSKDPVDIAKVLHIGTTVHTDTTLLADWRFKIEKVTQTANASAWIALGSLEIALPASGDGHAQDNASLECRLRGLWDETRRDLFPEVTLTFACRVRVSASPDPGLRNLNAEFDAATAAEETLHRDTEPLRYALDSEAGRLCQLTIKYLSRPGRNAVMAMEVRSQVRAPLGSDALYFQTRPFIFAKVHATDIDDQAGALIAVWRSDDADGPQWRVPDATLSFELPPQAVGEEMERGNRFWPGTTPAIDPNAPLRYRFARPTHVVVQPSVRARRYDKNPNNLAEALRGAKVVSFRTEMAYPLEINFQVSALAEPDVRIAETASFLGHPALNLPLAPRSNKSDPDDVDAGEALRWSGSVLSGELAAWAASPSGLNLGPYWRSFMAGYRRLRAAHNAAQANFAARLGQFHLYDPWSKDGGLHLREGLVFKLRGTADGAPALLNPLATRRPLVPPTTTEPAPNDLLPNQKSKLTGFLKDQQNGQFDWATERLDGALHAGVLYTIEFPSELLAVLRTPESSTGTIDTLAFTALGASGRFSAAFDEGRTTFIAETQHGQLSRLIKVRIGRIALLWNRAKHITVYERTTVSSKQFNDEQTGTEASFGWPILRKTEEYVEPIDIVRDFSTESQKESNATGFVEASECISRRIYVNSAWGRDVVHGYELPLWNRLDDTGFYPKPQLALRMHAGGGNRSRCWLDEPEHLYFYSNTEVGTGADPDHWDPKPQLDYPTGIVRLPQMTGRNLTPKDYLEKPAVPSPRLGGARRPRFDLTTVSDGKVNLQHARGDTEMLATLDLVALARTDDTATPNLSAFDPSIGKKLESVINGNEMAAGYAAVEARVRSMLDRLPRQMLESGLDCPTLKIRLHNDIDKLFQDLDADLRALTMPDLAALGKTWAEVVGKEVVEGIGKWQYGTADAIRLVLERTQKDLKIVLDALSQAEESTFRTLQQTVRARLSQLWQETDAALDAATQILATPLKQFERETKNTVADALKDVTTALDKIDTLLIPVDDNILSDLAHDLTSLRRGVEAARRVPPLAPVAAKAVMVLDQADHLVADFRTSQGASTHVLTDPLRKLVSTLRQVFERGWNTVEKAATTINTTVTALKTQRANWTTAIAAPLAQLDQATAVAELRVVVEQAATLVNERLSDANDALLKELDNNLKNIKTQVDSTLGDLKTELIRLATNVSELADNARAAAGTWLATARDAALETVKNIDCSALNAAHTALAEALDVIETRVREQVTGALGTLVDDATRAKLDELANIGDVALKVGKGIKLAKAIGELPALPTLSFNAERAEYLFEDLKKQIDTSPFAVRLRELDAGIKELGIALPTQQMLDQFVPDSLKSLDFNRIFKNLGGLDFQDFFKRFQLPDLGSDKIKITHGLDKATRSAWVTTTVNADFPEEQTLFEFSSVAVRVARMQLRANSDIRIAADGQRRAATDGRFTGDWGLDFGGTRMATFQDVTVRFDGNGFGFDMSPDKVQLHPSLKFIEEYAKQFQDNLPPAIQLEKDERGIPVGARAGFTTVIDNLPPLPPVTIGPIRMSSGLGLRMTKDGKFEISAYLALGAKNAPVFVQFGYLGGGFWLEARCTARGSEIVPEASLGLALGSTRAFTLAGVARGSYALLLFANAEVNSTGGSLHAGLSISGSARILGVANASLDLLLEVEHHSGGATAHGWLHVEIKICWCYTLRVSTAAQHKL